MAGRQTTPARLGTGGLLWLTSAQFFVVQALAQQAWQGSQSYSLRRSWISDLGATTCGRYQGGGGILVCSPRHAWLNGGLIVLGGQVLIGAVLLRPMLARTRLERAAFLLLATSGAALPFVAAFPEDTGKPWHGIAATIHLATAGLGTLAVGVCLRPGRRLASDVTLALGGASLLGTAFTAAGLGASLGARGALERLAAWPFTLWTTLAGAYVLAAVAGMRGLKTRRACPEWPA